MHKTNFTYLIILALGILIGAANVSTASDSGSQLPIICVPMLDDSIRVDTVWANPGQADVEVPVYFDAVAGDSIRLFEFEIAIPNGLFFTGIDSVETDWNTDSMIVYVPGDSSYIEVQGWGDILYSATATTHILTTLIFDIEDGIGFNDSIDLELINDVYFRIAGPGDTCAYDPNEVDGWINTGDDSIFVDIDEVNGCSYQAWDTTNTVKDTLYVRVPVQLYTCFRADYVNFNAINANPDCVFAGYGSAAYGAWAECYDDTVIHINASGTDIPAGTNTTLLELLFRVKDFSEEYNSDLSFDTSFALPSLGPDTLYTQVVRCYGSSQTVDLITDTNFDGGAVDLPSYGVTFQPGTAYADTVADTVQVPLYCNASFWAQFYWHMWKFDGTKLELTGVTATSDTMPQEIHVDTIDTIDDWVFIEIMTLDVQDDEYILPGSRVIYDFHFNTLTSSGTTRIYPGYAFSMTGLIQDYFTSYENSNKIYRSSFDSTAFHMYPGGWIYLSGSEPVMAPLEPMQTIDGEADIVSVEDFDPLPFSYSLEQNYPNPFNATTTISFSLAEQGPVQIDIYDMLGQKVKTLVAADLCPGYHQVQWNGANGNSSQVSSGLYFYILQANDYKQSRKMLLLK